MYEHVKEDAWGNCADLWKAKDLAFSIIWLYKSLDYGLCKFKINPSSRFKALYTLTFWILPTVPLSHTAQFQKATNFLFLVDIHPLIPNKYCKRLVKEIQNLASLWVQLWPTPLADSWINCKYLHKRVPMEFWTQFSGQTNPWKSHSMWIHFYFPHFQQCALGQHKNCSTSLDDINDVDDVVDNFIVDNWCFYGDIHENHILLNSVK